MMKVVIFLSYSSFLETNVPLLVLIEAAKAGNEKEVEEYALVFTEHANKLVEVSMMLTSSHLLQTGVEYSTPSPSVVLTGHC
jgi:catenin alpha